MYTDVGIPTGQNVTLMWPILYDQGDILTHCVAVFHKIAQLDGVAFSSNLMIPQQYSNEIQTDLAPKVAFTLHNLLKARKCSCRNPPH